MDFESCKATYLKDSQRIETPEKTVDSVLDQLKQNFGVTVDSWGHQMAPDMEMCVLEFDDPLYWKKRTSSRGKGLTREQSLASAMGEFVERYAGSEFIKNHEETSDPEARKIPLRDILPPKEESEKSKNELGGLYPSLMGDKCPLKNGGWRERLNMLLPWGDDCSCWPGVSNWKVALGYGGGIRNSMSLSAEESWTSFYSLKEDEKVNIPFDLLTATTNGLAAGNCREEAVLHGILESIERDESFRQLPRLDAETMKRNSFIHPSDIPEDTAKHFDREELDKIMVVHSRSELCPAVHVFTAMAIWKPKTSYVLAPDIDVAVASGANLDPEYALQRALTETFQVLSSVGAKEIVKPDPQFDVDYTEFDELENEFEDDLRANIQKCKESLRDTEDIYVRDIPAPGIDLDVAKCVISKAMGPTSPSIEPDFFEQLVNYDLSPIEKIGVRTMVAVS